MTTNTTTASLLVQGTTRNQARQADMENSDVRYLAPTTSLNSEDDVASFGRSRERIRERERIKKLSVKITGRWRFSNTWKESVLQSEFVHKVYSSKLHLLTSVSAKECSEPLIRGHCCWESSLCISQLHTEEKWDKEWCFYIGFFEASTLEYTHVPGHTSPAPAHLEPTCKVGRVKLNHSNPVQTTLGKFRLGMSVALDT